MGFRVGIGLLLGVVCATASGYEMLVEVSTDAATDTIAGPYVFRQASVDASNSEAASGGFVQADFRDASITAELQSAPGSSVTSRAITADFVFITVPDTYTASTIEIPWSMQVASQVDLDSLPDSLGLFRFRLLSFAGSVDETLRIEHLYDGTVSTDGNGTLEGVLSLPATDLVLSPYEIFVAELSDERAGSLNVSASASFELPDGLELFIEGCSLYEFQSAFDSDGDGIDDSLDTCKLIANPAQIDADGDGIGNRCDGDFNNDGETTPIDLARIRQVFFTGDPVADMNSDGEVNIADLGLFRLDYLGMPGPSCAMPGAATLARP